MRQGGRLLRWVVVLVCTRELALSRHRTAGLHCGLQGEEATAAAFEADPYGCSPGLQSKRQQRDPFAAGGYNGDRWGMWAGG